MRSTCAYIMKLYITYAVLQGERMLGDQYTDGNVRLACQ